jgi:hypothetical protein
MLKKVYSAFFPFLIICSLLASCAKNTEIDVPAPAAVTPLPLQTPKPSDSKVTAAPTPVQETVSPASTQKATVEKPKDDLVTQEVFLKLSSPEFKGRMMGSAGSEKGRSIIREIFKNMELEPYNKDFFVSVFKDPFRAASSDMTEKGDGYNAVGLLKGKKSDECLIISAHLDGSDKGSAALDNAGGVYCMLKTAEAISKYSRKNKLSGDIIFAAFDGEEQGLIGSGDLAEDIAKRYTRTIVINLDCVGVKDSDSYMVIGDAVLFDQMISSLYRQLELYSFSTVPVESVYNCDHLPFEWRGIPAVTIGERDVENIVHTPRDVSGNVDISEIDRLSEALCSYILEQGDSLFEIYFGNNS